MRRRATRQRSDRDVPLHPLQHIGYGDASSAATRISAGAEKSRFRPVHPHQRKAATGILPSNAPESVRFQSMNCIHRSGDPNLHFDYRKQRKAPHGTPNFQRDRHSDGILEPRRKGRPRAGIFSREPLLDPAPMQRSKETLQATVLKLISRKAGTETALSFSKGSLLAQQRCRLLVRPQPFFKNDEAEQDFMIVVLT